MDIRVAEEAGYCYGVERSLKMAREAADSPAKPIYTLGPLIHNPQVVQRLEAQGIRSISDARLADGCTMIIRCHGVDPAVIREARNAGTRVIDATCPFVMKVQKRAAQLLGAGYQVIIVGERDHPEIEGILAHTGNRALVVEDVSELPSKLSSRVGVVVQTTQTLSCLEKVVLSLIPRVSELKVYNTICDATTRRQEAAHAMAQEVDAMVVIGGHNSGNTNRLTDICRQTGTPTHHVESYAELPPGCFAECRTLGVTAGASTPDWVIEETVEMLREEYAQSASNLELLQHT